MLKDKFSYVEEVRPEKGDGWFVVPPKKLAEVCGFLKEKQGFDCLSSIAGTDRNGQIEIAYHFFSYDKKETVVLKVTIEVSTSANVTTISDLYPSANWMEREAFDLLGISFVGHPDMRRILLPEDWTGHPLRKDYKEGKEYCGMTTRR